MTRAATFFNWNGFWYVTESMNRHIRDLQALFLPNKCMSDWDDTEGRNHKWTWDNMITWKNMITRYWIILWSIWMELCMCGSAGIILSNSSKDWLYLVEWTLAQLAAAALWIFYWFGSVTYWELTGTDSKCKNHTWNELYLLLVNEITRE